MLANGTITLSSSCSIGPTTRRSAFLTSPEGLRSSSIVNDGRLSQYVLRGVRIFGDVFDVLLTFDGEALCTVVLGRKSKPAECGSHQRRALLYEKAANENWLRAVGNFGSKTTTAWGSVESVVDYAAGAAAIVVSFKTGDDSETGSGKVGRVGLE